MQSPSFLHLPPLSASLLNPFCKNRSSVTVKSPPRTTTSLHKGFASSATAPKRQKDAKKRVVITGMGLVSVFGSNVDMFYESLLAGENGIGLIDRFDVSKLATQFAGQIRECNSDGYINAKSERILDDYQRYCIVAGKKALEDAALGGDVLSKNIEPEVEFDTVANAKKQEHVSMPPSVFLYHDY